MKKTLFIATLLAGVVASFAQGTVNFANNVAFTTASPVAANGKTDRLVYWTDNSTALSGTNWVAQLFYAPGSGVTDQSTLNAIDNTPKGFFASTVTSFVGKWAPATKTFSNVDKGQTATLQVRVWDGSLYQTYGLASAAPGAITGKSVTFDYTVPSGTTPAPSAFYMEGLQSFTLQAAPEPSTIALGVLGAASLFFVRRRK